VCCRVLQRVAACCSVLQCVAVCCSVVQYVAVCCSLCLQFVALRYSVMHSVCSVCLQCVAVSCSVFQCVAVCFSVLQCVAVCCSVLQCVAVCCHMLCDATNSHSYYPHMNESHYTHTYERATNQTHMDLGTGSCHIWISELGHVTEIIV